MQLKISRDELLKPLQQVAGVVERRQTLPILANVLVSSRGNQLSMTATDLEVELKTLAPCESDDEIDVTLPARKLMDICKALPAGADVSISLDGERATLRSGRGRYALGILPAKDYPTIDPGAPGDRFELEEGVLKRLIERTQFAMAQQDVRYYLNGMLLEVRPGRLRTVATDGHRLALSEVSGEFSQEADIQVILPRKAVIELGRLLADGENTIVVDVGSSHLRVQLADATFTSKLIDGRFPDYEKVLPRGAADVMEVERDALRQALTRTAVLSNEKYRGVRFKLNDGNLGLLAHNPEQEEAEEDLAVAYQGKDISVGFNVGYLLDVLQAIPTAEIEIHLADANSSCLIKGKGQEDSRYVVMPMRL